MMVSPKRAENVAWLSLVLSTVFFITAFLLGRWSGFFAVTSVSWLILSSALIWFVMSSQFHQRSSAEQEKLDVSQLTETDEATKLFQTKGQHAEMFAIAQNRLKLLEKWFIPIFAALIAIFQIFIGLYLLKNIPLGPDIQTQQPLICAVYMTGIAFVSFLISRYATGMSYQLQWKPLRAGGSIMFCAAVLCFALAIALALANFKIYLLLQIIQWVIPVLIIILGTETALNVVLDIYRPRIKDQYKRSAFDSRLLGIINEPGKIFHTAASTIDYQFGFKVSQTWFYKLLEKAVMPLLLFGFVALYSLSCVVIVSPNEQAIIEHFGDPVKDSDVIKIFGPGLTFKWPWPIDIAYKYPTKKISEITIGYVPELDEHGEIKHEPRLWGKVHHAEEFNLLVAGRPTTNILNPDAVPVSLIVAAIPVQYKVRNLADFIYNHTEPEKILESICYQQLTRFAASATIEPDDDSDRQGLLGAGLETAKQILTERIQRSADKIGLGVEIVFVGVQGIHPPVEVAADFQQVIAAVQKKQANILSAHAYRNMTLSTLAGSVDHANKLYLLAQQYQNARGNSEQIEKISDQLDQAFAQANGEIFKTLREAQSYAFEKPTLAQATGQRFQGQLKAYRAAKDIFKSQHRLAMLEESLTDIRKFVVVADTNDTQVFIIDVQEKLTPSLYDIAGFEESAQK